jgi:hypothetical protein
LNKNNLYVLNCIKIIYNKTAQKYLLSMNQFARSSHLKIENVKESGASRSAGALCRNIDKNFPKNNCIYN